MMQEKSLEEHTFSKDLCLALVAANIPWSKLLNPVFRNFLAKYTSKKIPDESTLRKNYLENMYDTVVNHLCQEKEESGCKEIGLILKDAKAAFQLDSVVASLGYIGAHFSHLPGLIKQLEDSSLSLTESTKLVNQALINFPGANGEIVHQKMVMVLQKNLGWKQINNIKNALEGEGIGITNNLSPAEISSFKYAPIISCDVERSFSKHKHILSDKRTNFTENNLEKYIEHIHFTRK